MGTRLLGSRFEALIPHSQPTGKRSLAAASALPAAPSPQLLFLAAGLPEQPLYDMSGAGGGARVQ